MQKMFGKDNIRLILVTVTGIIKIVRPLWVSELEAPELKTNFLGLRAKLDVIPIIYLSSKKQLWETAMGEHLSTEWSA